MGCSGLLRKSHKDGLAGLPVYGPADMAAPGCVFGQQDIAAVKGSPGPVADFDFDTAFKHQDKLATWRIVPSIVIISVGFAEDDAADRKPLGKGADLSGIPERDVYLCKVGFTILAGVDTGHYHWLVRSVIGLLQYFGPGFFGPFIVGKLHFFEEAIGDQGAFLSVFYE